MPLADNDNQLLIEITKPPENHRRRLDFLKGLVVPSTARYAVSTGAEKGRTRHVVQLSSIHDALSKSRFGFGRQGEHAELDAIFKKFRDERVTFTEGVECRILAASELMAAK